MTENLKEFTQADDEMARKLQLAVLNAIYKQIQADPLSVSASTLAVAERLLARYNVGLGWGIRDDSEDEMTAEEKKALEEFEKLKINIESDLFE
jgi:hypothetical protein